MTCCIYFIFIYIYSRVCTTTTAAVAISLKYMVRYLSSLHYTEGLAWDWVTKKVYWTDSERRRISVYDPEHNIRKVVTRTGSNSAPKDIALDPMTG